MQTSTLETLIALGAAIVVIGVWLWARRRNWVSETEARDLLWAGAKVIDVRTPAEFAHDHVPGALNVPLGGVRERMAEVVPDRETPLLLHCHSGGRSGIARAILRRAGYPHVHNLGSFGRARDIVTRAARPD